MKPWMSRLKVSWTPMKSSTISSIASASRPFATKAASSFGAGMDVVDPAGRLCALALLGGREEVCPDEACPLWEDGGCALERLTAEGELYADAWPEDDPAALGQVQPLMSG
jgi:hypothetical protein